MLTHAQENDGNGFYCMCKLGSTLNMTDLKSCNKVEEFIIVASRLQISGYQFRGEDNRQNMEYGLWSIEYRRVQVLPPIRLSGVEPL